MSIVAFAIAAGLYLLWVQVMCFYMGGYVTGRLRAREPGASEHEVDVRDGLHGLVCWAIGVMAAAFIAFIGIGGLGAARPQGQVAASVAQVVEKEVNQAAAQEQASAAPSDTTTVERRAEIRQRYREFQALSAEDQARVRMNFAKFKSLDEKQRAALMRRWNQLSPQERAQRLQLLRERRLLR
jgi:hypothetical protein